VKKDFKELKPYFSIIIAYNNSILVQSKVIRENFFRNISNGSESRFIFFKNLFKLIQNEERLDISRQHNSNYNNIIKFYDLPNVQKLNYKEIKPVNLSLNYYQNIGIQFFLFYLRFQQKSLPKGKEKAQRLGQQISQLLQEPEANPEKQVTVFY